MKYLRVILSLLLATSLLGSCTKDNYSNKEDLEQTIQKEKPSKKEPKQKPSKKDKEIKEEDSFNDNSLYAKPSKRSNVVSVHFSGQLCHYCPKHSQDLYKTQEEYGKDKYIIVTLHPVERFSKLTKQQGINMGVELNGRYTSLFNEEAITYAKNIEILGVPFHFHNTLSKNGNKLPLNLMYEEADLLACKADAKVNDGKIDIHLQTKLREDRQDFIIDKEIDLIFWIKESKIQALQMEESGKLSYPLHNNIFRGTLNSVWGEPYTVGETYDKSFKLPKTITNVENTDLVILFVEHKSQLILDAKVVLLK